VATNKSGATETLQAVPFIDALVYWFKLGFISFGGPAVEATRGDIKFTGLLTGITAVVVGVILNMTVFLLITYSDQKVLNGFQGLSVPLHLSHYSGINWGLLRLLLVVQ